MTTKAETIYEHHVASELMRLFPGCYVTKQDAQERQGIPDLLMLYGPYWAMLEVKVAWDAPFQPNQEWYLADFGNMSFTAVIFPENEIEVMHALQRSFGSSG